MIGVILAAAIVGIIIFRRQQGSPSPFARFVDNPAYESTRGSGPKVTFEGTDNKAANISTA